MFRVLHILNTSLISKRNVCKIKVYGANSCFRILRVLYQEGYILNYTFNKLDSYVYVTHNYYKNRPSINILKIYDKASFPTYIKYMDLLAVHKFGVDLLILSTPQGLMPHYQAMKKRLGGRVICYLR